MTDAYTLLAAQAGRWREIDPLLPAPLAPPTGAVLTAATANATVAGTVRVEHHPQGSAERTWSPAYVTELNPLLGAGGHAEMDALVRAWRTHLDGLPEPPSDSGATLTWPSRDVAAGRALLDHGLVPLSVIAVHTPLLVDDENATAPELVIRAATMADVPACTELAMAEQAYSAMAGAAIVRAETPALRRTVVATRIARGDPVWVAEHDGMVIGMAECGLSDGVAASWTTSRLPTGLWGYINCASVLPGARSRGVGRALVARAHAGFAAAGARGAYLYYNPPNPLSSVFWPRQGYRPLWTVWEARPVTALR